MRGPSGIKGIMQALIRQILGMAAAFALALQTALWGIAPMHAALPIDPLAVICHSEASNSTDPAPDGLPSAPAHACDHCNLCNASAPPLPQDTLLAGRFAPTPTFQAPYLVDTARHDDVVTHSRLARGPPAFA